MDIFVHFGPIRNFFLIDEQGLNNGSALNHIGVWL